MPTKRQQEYLDYIFGYYNEQGITPTLLEIRDAMGIKSISSAFNMITELIESGFIERHYYLRRGIQLPQPIILSKKDYAKYFKE